MKKILDLFITFFKIGLFTFGGGYAMISTIRETIVENKKWITDDELMQIITIAESTPGPIAINMATFIGAEQGGILGSIVATLGVVLPSFIIILLVASLLKRFIKNKYVQAFLKGVKPVVLGLILSTTVFIAFASSKVVSIGLLCTTPLAILFENFSSP